MSENNSSLPEDAKAKLAAALGGSVGADSSAGASTSSGNGSLSDATAAAKRGGSKRRSTDPDAIFQTVLRVIEDAAGIDQSEITAQSRIDDDLNVDSLSKIDIAVQLEDKYGVRLEDEDVSGTTVQRLVDTISKRVG